MWNCLCDNLNTEGHYRSIFIIICSFTRYIPQMSCIPHHWHFNTNFVLNLLVFSKCIFFLMLFKLYSVKYFCSVLLE